MKKYRVPKTAITEKGLKRLIRDAARKSGSLSEWAKNHKIYPQTISAFLHKKQGAGLQIPEALGYRPQIVFLPIDEELISTPNPPRRAVANPSKKVDHTREPIERRYRKPISDRDATKKRLKARKA